MVNAIFVHPYQYLVQ